MSETSENNSELDEYGVWIKKAALDANENESLEDHKNEVSSLPEISDIEDSFSFDTSDILSEDISDFENKSEEIDVTEEKDSAESESESLNTLEEEAIASEISNLESFNLDEINTEENIIPDIEEEKDSAESENESLNTLEEETIASEVSNLESFNLDEINTEGETLDGEGITLPKEDEIEVSSDGDIDLSAFMDDSSAPADGDVDLSAFMGGGDESVSFGDGDIDLSAFMGGESFATEKEEEAEIEDADPLDIDLEFEETDVDFQENNDKDDSFSSGFDTLEENFDSIFEDIKDETPVPEPTEDKPEVRSTEEIMGSGDEIDLSDFGFSDDSENLNPVIGDGSAKKVQTVVDYNMNIDIEEDDNQDESTGIVGSEEAKAENSSDDEEITVDISMDQGKAEQKTQKTDLSSPDDSFDIDSIFSNIEDENGETVKFDTGNESEVPSVENPIEDSASTKEELDVVENSTILEETSVQDDIPSFDDGDIEIEKETIDTQEPTIEDTIDETQTEKDPSLDDADFSFEEPIVDTIDSTQEEPVDSSLEELSSLNEEDLSFLEEPVEEDAMASSLEESSSLDDVPTLDDADFSFLEEPAKVNKDEVQEEKDSSLETDFSFEEPKLDSTEEEEGPSLDDVSSLNEEDLSFLEEPVEEDAMASSIEDVPSLEDVPTLDDADFSFLEEPAKVDKDEVQEETSEKDSSDETDFSFEEPIVEDTIDSTQEEEPSLDEVPTLDDADFSFEEPKLDSTEEEDKTIISENEISTEEPSLPTDTLNIEETPEIEEETGISQDEISRLEEDLENTEVSDTTLDKEEGVKEPTIEDIYVEPENDPILSESEEKEDSSTLDVSSYIDEKPEYDMTGVSVSVDNLKDAEIIEEDAGEKEIPDTLNEDLPEEESFESDEEKNTYSVFVKTDDSSSKVEETQSQAAEYDSSDNEDILEEQMKGNKNDFNSEEILSKIAEDLASLKTEINDLKDEFEELKKNGIQLEEESNEEVPSLDSIVQPTKENSGFFSDTDEDDTIALSGDELGNILNSAEFTETEEDESGNETIEELESASENEEELSEEEITVPTVEEKPHVITDDDLPSSPTLERFDLPPVFDENGPVDDVAEPLTEENIDYLTSEVPEEMQEEEDENLEVGISEQPVEGVFSNWQAAGEENQDPIEEVQKEPHLNEVQEEAEPVEEIEEPLIEEEVSSFDNGREEESVSEKEKPSSLYKENQSNEIPSDMKEEIKSVLSYMDQLLENLPEEKIAEFARSEQFETYKKLFSELGLV